MRVLIADYDFFTAIGGGQTLYRRIVERNPDIEFWYPSRGSDAREAARGKLPPNANPYVFDPHVIPGCILPFRKRGFTDLTHGNSLAKLAMPIQGMVFDAIDVPSFFPCAHLVRPILAAYGVAVGRVAHGLVGWPSISVRNGYGDECSDDLADKLRAGEELSIRASDVLYSIEGLYADEASTLGRPLVNLALRNTLESFPPPAPEPAGEGLPDLWYVGRLDRTKGPDLFLDMVARLPRTLYGKCYFTGPDNRIWTQNASWSDRLVEQAARLGLDASYRGQISDAVLRDEVYGGRSVVVVPSRSDVINYVALEAMSCGCPIVLSKHAGAAEYLQQHHPEVLPPIIDPENSEASAAALQQLLESYDDSARTLRRNIRARPLSEPQPGFMRAVYAFSPEPPRIEAALPGPHPLLTPAAESWRPVADCARQSADVAVVVTVRDRPAQLAATLAALVRQTVAARDILVVDDGTRDPAVIRRLVGQYPEVRWLRQGRQGPGWAANAGWQATEQPIVAFCRAGDLPDAGFLATALAEWDDSTPFQAYLPNLLSAPNSGDDPLAPGQPTQRPDGNSEAAGLVISRAALTRLKGFEPQLGSEAPAKLQAALARFGVVQVAGPDAPGLWRYWPPEPVAARAPPAAVAKPVRATTRAEAPRRIGMPPILSASMDKILMRIRRVF